MYGEFDEEIYMKFPPGLKTNGDKILTLEKCIYGLVKADRQYYKMEVAILKKLGFAGEHWTLVFLLEGVKKTFSLLFMCMII